MPNDLFKENVFWNNHHVYIYNIFTYVYIYIDLYIRIYIYMYFNIYIYIYLYEYMNIFIDTYNIQTHWFSMNIATYATVTDQACMLFC